MDRGHTVTTPLYDAFSADYDRFVDWEGRLRTEMGFIVSQLGKHKAERVLDVACGTGRHAIALAQGGYQVTGVDISRGMIERARENASQAGVEADFAVAGFGQLAAQAQGPFDAVLCLGNSLPHALTPQALDEALVDLAQVLRPGGLLLVQNRNFDLVLERRERWMEPQPYKGDHREWIFVRFYDWGDRLLTFNVVTLYREGDGPWQQQAESTQLWPMRQSELEPALVGAGFGELAYWGDMQGSPYIREQSGNLVITATRL